MADGDLDGDLDAVVRDALPLVDIVEAELARHAQGRGALGLATLTIARGRIVADLRRTLGPEERAHFESFLAKLDEWAADAQELAEAVGYDAAKLGGAGTA